MGPKLLSQSSLVNIVTELIVLPKFVYVIRCMAAFVVFQSILVFTGAGLVLGCVFEPSKAWFEFDQLVRFMYLYDYNTCTAGKSVFTRNIEDLKLADDTFGLKVLPIKFEHVITAPLSKLPAATRKYLQIHIAFHILWIGVMCMVCFYTKRKGPSPLKKLKLYLGICFYYSIFMLAFDISMAIVYAAHIQQSLTKGMILRYSGTNIMVTIQDMDTFGGWVPISASIMWLRGIVILGVNAYFLRCINHIRKSTRRREYTKIFSTEGNTNIPEAQGPSAFHSDVLILNVNDEPIHRPN